MDQAAQNLSMRAAIIGQMERIAKQQSKVLAPLTDRLPLVESGLDSLCLAVLVASLDDELGLDPFFGDDYVEFPVTIGDFIKLYENAQH
jgi:acyl carrier protein